MATSVYQSLFSLAVAALWTSLMAHALPSGASGPIANSLQGWGPGVTGNDAYNLRDTESIRGAPKVPDSDDGLGSLLLKNLRFRDLSAVEDGLYGQAAMPGRARQVRGEEYPGSARLAAYFRERFGGAGSELNHGVEKRQSVSVEQLAQLLTDLKKNTRNIDDDGVKLQSLRFGRK